MKKIKEWFEDNLHTIIIIGVIILIIMSMYIIIKYPVMAELSEDDEKQLRELEEKQNFNPFSLIFYIVLIAGGLSLIFLRIGCLFCFDCEQGLIPLFGIGVIIFAFVMIIIGEIK